jgi:hypothetical protein
MAAPQAAGEVPMKKLLLLVGLCVILGGVGLVPVGTDQPAPLAQPNPPQTQMDLSSYSDARPARPLQLLFIHHSVGGALLADAGPVKEISRSILESHPEGGGLRAALAAQGYRVSEASYGSKVGDKTDLFDWLPKFRDQMDLIRKVDLNDDALPDGQSNQIVMFKSCYPNNRFAGEGDEPGDPAGPELTLANAKATLMALRDELAKHPDLLFVYVTAPPVAARVPKDRAWKWLAKKILGRPAPVEVVSRSAEVARQFNRWVAAPDGWLAGYPHKNVVVFDYYHVLTDEGASNFSRYSTGAAGGDSHPSRAGNEKAVKVLIPLLNHAVRRAGLSE